MLPMLGTTPEYFLQFPHCLWAAVGQPLCKGANCLIHIFYTAVYLCIQPMLFCPFCRTPFSSVDSQLRKARQSYFAFDSRTNYEWSDANCQLTKFHGSRFRSNCIINRSSKTYSTTNSFTLYATYNKF